MDPYFTEMETKFERGVYFDWQNGMDAYTDTDEVDEVEEEDRERFADQLCSIGILGRLAPEHCVPLLAK